MSLIPDKIFASFEELTVDFLKENGISALILDVDNTLIPYEEKVPSPAVVEWIAALTEAGVKLSFVTNNHKGRLLVFNESLRLPAFANSFKPFLKNIRAAMRAMGSDTSNTANLGDQIFTDTWAGKRMGIRTFLVPPIRDKRDPFTRLKRLLEKPVLRKYYKKNSTKKVINDGR